MRAAGPVAPRSPMMPLRPDESAAADVRGASSTARRLPDGWRLRRAAPEDAHAVADFAVRVFRETYDCQHGGASRTEDVEAYLAEYLTRETIARDLADPAVTIVVAETPEGALAGYVQLRAGSRPEPGARVDPARIPGDAPTMEIARMYVDQRWHGRGVAAPLFRSALDLARESAAVTWLCVFRLNARAVAFYEKQGLRVAGTQTFVMGEERQEDWLMASPPGT